MKPQLGDTISNRYVLVSPLREETGLQVWKASDHVLARDCQLFIVNNRKALQDVNATASMLAISHDAHFTQVLQLQHVGEVALVITQLDAGMSLSEYLTQSSKPLTSPRSVPFLVRSSKPCTCCRKTISRISRSARTPCD